MATVGREPPEPPRKPWPAHRWAPVYVEGKLAATLSGQTMAGDFLPLLDEYVERRFGKGGAGA